MYGFHSKEGWYFERTADGGVRIVKTNGMEGGPVEATVELTENTWASIVASVSEGGETGARYREALYFHKGLEIEQRAMDKAFADYQKRMQDSSAKDNAPHQE